MLYIILKEDKGVNIVTNGFSHVFSGYLQLHVKRYYDGLFKGTFNGIYFRRLISFFVNFNTMFVTLDSDLIFVVSGKLFIQNIYFS